MLLLHGLRHHQATESHHHLPLQAMVSSLPHHLQDTLRNHLPLLLECSRRRPLHQDTVHIPISTTRDVLTPHRLPLAPSPPPSLLLLLLGIRPPTPSAPLKPP